MADELLDIYDEENISLGKQKMKNEVHRDGDWHRALHLWVISMAVVSGLLMKWRMASPRLVADTLPSRSRPAAGGHVHGCSAAQQVPGTPPA